MKAKHCQVKTCIQFTYLDKSITLQQKQKGIYDYTPMISVSSKNQSVKFLPLLRLQYGHSAVSIINQKDEFYFQYYLKKDDTFLMNLAKKELHIKLQVLYNMKFIFDCVKKGYTYILHPNNLVFNYNMIPKVIYVGFENVLYPIEQSKQQLLIQYKCLIISTLYEDLSYDYLLNGAIEYVKRDYFLMKVVGANTIDDLITIVYLYFIEQKEIIRRKKIFINKRTIRFYKFGFLFLIIMNLVLVVFTVMMLSTKTSSDYAIKYYLDHEYVKVIDIFEHTNLNSLTGLEKYMLVLSYLSVDDDNREYIANYTVNDDSYIWDFWISFYRQKYLDALKFAKTNSDLTLEYKVLTTIIENGHLLNSNQEHLLKNIKIRLIELEEILNYE